MDARISSRGGIRLIDHWNVLLPFAFVVLIGFAGCAWGVLQIARTLQYDSQGFRVVDGYHIHPDQNFSEAGKNFLAMYEIDDEDPGQCAQLCRKTTSCAAFAVSRRGKGGAAKAQCWLQRAVSPPVKDSCCVLGVPQ